VNADCKTATIDFDERCIVEKGDMFQNYPNLGDEDTYIETWQENTALLKLCIPAL
jgi:hypothetical protein